MTNRLTRIRPFARNSSVAIPPTVLRGRKFFPTTASRDNNSELLRSTEFGPNHDLEPRRLLGNLDHIESDVSGS